MRTSYFSPILVAACATLTACGGGSDAAFDDASTASTMSSSSASLASTTYANASQTPANWVACATEDTICKFTGTAQVRYGTAEKYVVKALTGPVSCSNTVFGDPMPGYAKTCSLGVTPVAETAKGELTWSVCAKEDGNCAFNGSAQVRYGTADKYVTKTLNGPVACSNAVFGDPAPGYGKTCSVGVAATPAPVLPEKPAPDLPQTPAPGTGVPASWTQCATEDNICAFSGSAQVRYGTADKFVIKSLTGPVSCSNTVFGDPAPNYGKSCSISSGSADPAPTPAPAPINPSTPAPAPSTPSNPVPAPQTGAITTVQLSNSTASAQTNAAATFGQVFAQGDVRNGETLVGRSSNGASVPLQVDVKARHADGSLRHAVITASLPNSAANGVDTISLLKGTAPAVSTPASPTALLNNGFTAVFTATIGNVQYKASADEALKTGKFTTWLSGPLANEWLVQTPLKTASGVEHPHLMAQFAIRSYTGSNSARVDVTIENSWAFQASPQNFTYNAQMLVGGQQVFSQAGLTHYHHARWRKLFWWGKPQALNVRHYTKYIIASKAVPNYDQSLSIKETTIASMQSAWNSSKTGPMQVGVGMAYMPTTGARNDIGLMPTWNALYLLTMDQRMHDVAIGMSQAAGSWSIHYRDKATGRPVTLSQYPYLSANTRGYETLNPATNKLEAFPECPAASCATPAQADTAHQPAFSYVPYLLTGDYYHLEELQFWANWSSYNISPNYREIGKGLVIGDQVRGQAWTLRTVTEAAYITPDNDPQKANFTAVLNHNIDWYSNTYSKNTGPNKLGVITNGYALEYNSNTSIAPWQDDFFTMVTGRMVELGFTKAQPLLEWKSKFVVDRMATSGFCWIMAPAYNLKLRDTSAAPFYTTINQVYQNSFASNVTTLSCASAAMGNAFQIRPGEMIDGLSTNGMQAIMQPALAYASGVNANGAKAWSVFAARPYKPDFSVEPQYAILPR